MDKIFIKTILDTTAAKGGTLPMVKFIGISQDRSEKEYTAFNYTEEAVANVGKVVEGTIKVAQFRGTDQYTFMPAKAASSARSGSTYPKKSYGGGSFNKDSGSIERQKALGEAVNLHAALISAGIIKDVEGAINGVLATAPLFHAMIKDGGQMAITPTQIKTEYPDSAPDLPTIELDVEDPFKGM